MSAETTPKPEPEDVEYIDAEADDLSAILSFDDDDEKLTR
jgi:hypothetical protein